jgi:indole-3-glycerol phosphate synthase
MKSVSACQEYLSEKGKVLPLNRLQSSGKFPGEGAFLKTIVQQKTAEILEVKNKRRSLVNTLRNNDLTVIAEVKRASPSRGVIKQDFNPEEQLRKYEDGGAGAISVLTDREFFRGSSRILQHLRSCTDLPLLRKDFILDPLQVYESRFLGADVILLILAILDDRKLAELLDLAHSLGLEAILEVHNEEELHRALKTEGKIIGINNRNLDDFSVDLSITAKLMKEYRNSCGDEERFFISESGIKTVKEVEELVSTGVSGILVGETLMRAEYPERLIGNFIKAARI